MTRKLLAIFAHPDDEAFGPGGTLVKYASEGVEIHLLCATRGEAGLWDENSKSEIRNSKPSQTWSKLKKEIEIHHVREKELLQSAKVLGVARVEFLDFVDGTLCNANYHQLADKITEKIKVFAPQVVLTLDRLGISGHLDHIAVSLTTTYSFIKSNVPQKLYYQCMPKENRDKELDNYFIYFPEGVDGKDITTRIDWSDYWDKKVEAMHQHKSQTHDVERILKRIVKQKHIDYFILQHYRGLKPKFPETDLFGGIGG